MNASRHILIVDGNAAARAELAHEVGRLGYVVSQAGTAADATSLVLFRAARVDLLLMETALPDGDGREVVARLRRRGVMLPVVLVAAAASEDDVVWGLDAGADDYLARPLRPRELGARIRAQFRVAATREDADVQIGAITFRPGTRTVFHPDMPRPVRLTEKEAALLLRLCRAEGRPVSRQTLLREVWGYSPGVSSHTVETHIYRLRRKIEPGGEADGPALLLNEEGGYRLATGERPEPADFAAASGWQLAGRPAPRLAVGEAAN